MSRIFVSPCVNRFPAKQLRRRLCLAALRLNNPWFLYRRCPNTASFSATELNRIFLNSDPAHGLPSVSRTRKDVWWFKHASAHFCSSPFSLSARRLLEFPPVQSPFPFRD